MDGNSFREEYGDGRSCNSDEEDEDKPKDGEIRFVCNDSAFAIKMKGLGHKPLKDAMIPGWVDAANTRV